MAQDSFNFYKYNSADTGEGEQKQHSSFSTNVLTTGGTYCRDYATTSGIVKCLLTGSSFSDLDDTKAVSLRAKVRTYSSSGHIMVLAKTDTAVDSQWYNQKGYMFGIRYYGKFHTYDGTSYYDTSSGVTVSGMNSSYTGQWVHVRMDIEPVKVGGTLTGDKIKVFLSSDDGSTWSLQETFEVATTDNGFVPWSDSTRNKYGFQIYKGYIDDFEIYLSTGYV